MNSKIERELRRAVSEQQRTVETPGFETILERASRHQRRRRLASFARVLAGVTAVGGIAWLAVAPGGPAENAVPGREASASAPSINPARSLFEIPTNGWRPGIARMDSRVYGTLRFTEDDCPFLESPGADVPRIWLAFPDNAQGVKEGSGLRHVTDPDGRVYGTEGEILDGGGGPIRPGGVENKCHPGNKPNTYGLGFMDKPTDKVVDLNP